MSLRNDSMRFSVLGFRSDIRIELQAPEVYTVADPGFIDRGFKFTKGVDLLIVPDYLLCF